MNKSCFVTKMFLMLACVVGFSFPAVANQNYKVLNATVFEEQGLNFDNPKMQVFFKNTENKKNFVNGKTNIGYVYLPTTKLFAGIEKEYQDYYMLFTVDEKSKTVDVFPYLIKDKRANGKTPNIVFKSEAKNIGLVCSKPNVNITWSGQSGTGHMINKKTSAENCVAFFEYLDYKDSNVFSKWSGLEPHSIKEMRKMGEFD